MRSNRSGAHVVGTHHVTAMIIKESNSLKALIALVMMCAAFLSCSPDYGLKYDVIEEIRPTTVVVDSFVQSSPPESIDVLIILDTSGSMNDNYDNVSAGVELLRIDEDEQSAIPTDIFHDWLMTEFAEVQQDVVTIVLTEESACDSAYSSMIGLKYIDLSSRFYKDAVDLCSDWSLWLADSTFLVGIVQELALTGLPVLESIVVYLNGSETLDWSYDATANMILLNFEPSPGDLIEVGYVVF